MEIIIIVGLILLNGIFAMSEIALISSRKSKLEMEAKKGSKSAQSALKLSSEPDKFLSTIQIGITLIGILTGLYSGEAFAKDLADYISGFSSLNPSYLLVISKTLIVIIVTYLTLIFGELVPKRIGMSMSEKIAMMIASPMTVLSKIATPFVWLLSKTTSFFVNILGLDKYEGNKVTEEEIKAIVKEGCSNGEVQEVEQDIVERVFSLGDRSIDSIMTHRSELVCLDIADSVNKIKEKVQSSLHTVYPAISGDMDQVVGVVFLKNLFGKIEDTDFTLQKYVSPAQYMPENQNVYTALEQFKRTRINYAIVTDEFGAIQGIVTLKDIMEGLIGELHNDGEESDIIQRADGSWLVEGQCSFYDFLEYFEMEELYSKYTYNTLSGLILNILGHVPVTGERLEWMNLNMEIVDMDGARIDKVLVSKK